MNEVGSIDATLDRAALYREAKEAFAAHAELARSDPREFNQFVLRDEESGEQVENARVHDLMHTCVDESDRTIILAHIESGKTNSITIGRTLYELGHNPMMRGAIISVTQPNASKFLRPIKRYIEQSHELRAVFPDLRKGPVWQETQIIIDRNSTSKDPTLQAIGIHGGVIGARLDYVVGDDLLDHDNTRTKAQRDDVYDWFHSTVLGRLTRDAKIILLGTAWHKQDLLQRLSRRRLWFTSRFPVEKKNPETGEVEPTWVERWSKDRIAEERELLGPLESKKQLDVVAAGESEEHFKETYIQRCLRRGFRIPVVHSRDELARVPSPLGRVFDHGGSAERGDDGKFGEVPRLVLPGMSLPIFTGVDLAGKRTKRSAHTVMFTLAIFPNGSRLVLEIKAGKWDGPTIRDNIIDAHRRFGSIFMVENNATQGWILQFVSERDAVPMYPFTTGKNKANADFGVETLALEFSDEKWIIPSDKRSPDEYMAAHDEIDNWLDELRDYDPQEHTGDRVMASWFAREAARRFMRKKGKRRRGGGVRVIGGKR